MDLEKIKDTFNHAEKYPYIKRVGVFGSYARGEEQATSDLDILLDYDNSSDEYMDDLARFMEDIENIITIKIDYVTYNGLMRSKDTSFKQEVLKEVKWLYVAKLRNTTDIVWQEGG